MKHINEQTLELLVLGDIKAKKRERQIRKHLAECAGCADLYSEIRDYYANVRLEGNDVSVPVPSMAQRSLVTKRNELEPYFASPQTEVVSYTEVTSPSRWRRLQKFGGEHPVVSSFGAMLMITGLALLFSHLSRSDDNPGYFYLDDTNHRIEVFSSNDKLLWSVNALHMAEQKSEGDFTGTTSTLLVDVNNDQRDELLTTVQIPQAPGHGWLRVYNKSGELRHTFKFPLVPVAFRGVHYDTPYGAQYLLKLQMADKSWNIFLSLANGRSPGILARLDNKLKIVGEYWHFGNFRPYLLSKRSSRPSQIALVGSNDIGDISGHRHEFLAIIDPYKIVGDGESSATRGFGYPVSRAEEYYLRFPRTDLEAVLGEQLNSVIEPDNNDSVFYVGLKSNLRMDKPNSFGFDFVIDRNNMSVREVKIISNTEVLYAKLKREGKVTGTLGAKYLENLKNGVRYWNGSEWVKTPTRIEHSEIAAK